MRVVVVRKGLGREGERKRVGEREREKEGEERKKERNGLPCRLCIALLCAGCAFCTLCLCSTSVVSGSEERGKGEKSGQCIRLKRLARNQVLGSEMVLDCERVVLYFWHVDLEIEKHMS